MFLDLALRGWSLFKGGRDPHIGATLSWTVLSRATLCMELNISKLVNKDEVFLKSFREGTLASTAVNRTSPCRVLALVT